MTPLLVTFYLVAPVVVIALCLRSRIADRIGAVILCYAAGITLGSAGVLPAGAAELQADLGSAAVAVALPLLLFSLDVAGWSRGAGKAFVSLGLACVAVVVAATAGTLALDGHVERGWQLGGMAVAVYTGGTPNLAALGAALDVDPATYVTLHTYDTVVSFVYVVFLISIAQRLFGRLLGRFASDSRSATAAASDRAGEPLATGAEYRGMGRPRTVLGLCLATVLSLGIVGVAAAASRLAAPVAAATSVGILTITSLGIAASFVPAVRRIEKTFELGMYVILVFCLVVGSMVDLGDLARIRWPILGFVVFCVFGSLLLHAALCRLARIDTDTFLITSVAAICSPPFVPVVATALGNRAIILSGLTTGIVGYAVANYLGIGLAHALRGISGAGQ